MYLFHKATSLASLQPSSLPLKSCLLLNTTTFTAFFIHFYSFCPCHSLLVEQYFSHPPAFLLMVLMAAPQYQTHLSAFLHPPSSILPSAAVPLAQDTAGDNEMFTCKYKIDWYFDDTSNCWDSHHLKISLQMLSVKSNTATS